MNKIEFVEQTIRDAQRLWAFPMGTDTIVPDREAIQTFRNLL
jgi:hypothetical protein